MLVEEKMELNECSKLEKEEKEGKIFSKRDKIGNKSNKYKSFKCGNY